MVSQMNFRYRIYPSQKQIVKLNKTISDCCFIYNKLLEAKVNAYKTDKTNLSQFDLNKLTKDFDVPIHSQVKQNISKRINDAFQHFFRRVKQKKGKVGFPRFKNINRYKSITFPQSGFKFISDKRIFVSKIGNIPIILHRVPKGKLKTFCIKKTALGWFAIFSCADIPIEQIEVKDNHIGIDVGIKSFAVLSDGTKIENPKFLRKSEKKLSKLQRRLSRKKKGSANRRKARFKVARLHQRIFNQRQDFLHKTSFSLIKQFKIISVEKLQIKNMVQNHYLAKSIADASWGCFFQMLSYKVEKTGGQLIKVNPENTSRTCSKCGNIKDMLLASRKFKCLKCGFVCHRDLNSAILVDRAGLVQISSSEENACGDTVRPSSEKARVD
ncbi:MAG TPA: transposase [Candidatus Pacearchaeota archaeon]|nr:transposase [Candidatus Pacearchaeota archaeon]